MLSYQCIKRVVSTAYSYIYILSYQCVRKVVSPAWLETDILTLLVVSC